MQSFDDWMDENCSSLFDMPHQSEAYEAGAQSRQAEIDELHKQLHEKVVEINKLLDIVSSNHALQKRINKAISAVMNDKCSHTVVDILKGETNE